MEEFSEEVFLQFEALRIFGFVNMMDRVLIQQLALFLDFFELAEVASDRKRYSQLLQLYSKWAKAHLN